MRYTLSVNQSKCQEWGINLAQGALFDLLNQASSWAETANVDDEVYYWVSRNKVLDEIPLAYNKADTVYRSLKVLEQKGLIHYTKQGKKDLIKLTEKGKSWNVFGTTQGDAKLGNKSESPKNSEIDSSKLGNKSRYNSEIDPTDNNTKLHKSISNKNTAKQSVNSEKKITGLDDFELSGEQDLTAAAQKKADKVILANSLLDNWIKLTGQKLRARDSRLEQIIARLDDGFTANEIDSAMEYLANSDWHQENGQIRIELAIRDTKQLEGQLIKSKAAAEKPVKKDPLAVNDSWENSSKRTPLVSTVSYEEMFGESQ